MTIGRAGPKDTDAVRGQHAGLLHSLQGDSGDRPGIILAAHNPLNDISITIRVVRLALIAKRGQGQILTGVDSPLFQEMVGEQP